MLGKLLFGSGEFPADLRAEVEREGVILLEENLRGTITWRDYRAPGRRHGLKKAAISGAVAVTRRRVVVWAARQKAIDVPLGHDAVEISQDGEKVLVAFDVSAFHADRSGRVEVRLKTPSAARIVAVNRR